MKKYKQLNTKMREFGCFRFVKTFFYFPPYVRRKVEFIRIYTHPRLRQKREHYNAVQQATIRGRGKKTTPRGSFTVNAVFLIKFPSFHTIYHCCSLRYFTRLMINLRARKSPEDAIRMAEFKWVCAIC